MVAVNFNGEGPSSPIAFLKPCSLPSKWSKPILISNTQASVRIGWNEPQDNGGCPITSYAVFVDDGNNGNFVEANVDNDIMVRDQPSLSQLTITRNVDQPASVGKIFRVKVRAFNPAGYVDSIIIGIRLAVVPVQPSAPTKVIAGSDQSKITIDLSAYDLTTNSGGCTIQTLEVQMDDGRGGIYQS